MTSQSTQENSTASTSRSRSSASRSTPTKRIARLEDRGSKLVKADISALSSSLSSSPSSTASELDVIEDPSRIETPESKVKSRSKTEETVSSSTASAAGSNSHGNSTWHFPIPSYLDNKPMGSVKSWTSTYESLLKMYNSMHHLQSTASSPSSKSSTLQTALIHYNYLAHLQTLYDTPLIPRRIARTLFILQGREPKTKSNQAQLLKIAADLIWLNEKDRQVKRQGKRDSRPTDATPTTEAIPIMPYVHNPANDYHGLRVSEYTILMNWIGTISDPSSSFESKATNTTSPSLLSNSSQHEMTPADRVWSLWHDFLLTGMKPDVVLCTALIEVLLKAKEYDRADQIWRHMHRQDQNPAQDSGNKTNHSRSNRATRAVTDSVSKTLGIETGSIVSSPSPLPSSSVKEQSNSPRKSSAIDLLDMNHHQRTRSTEGKRRSRSQSQKSIMPNTQTFSVLMQTHVLNRDLRGVAQTYKEFLQSTSENQQQQQQQLQQQLQFGTTDTQKHINSVLLNQILTSLVNLGENKIAKEIYIAMIQDREHEHPTIATAVDDNTEAISTTPAQVQTEPKAVSKLGGNEESIVIEEYSNKSPYRLVLKSSSVGSSTPPVHHQTFQRRWTWEKRRRREARKSPGADTSVSSSSSSSSSSSPSIGPNETTHKLILQLAQRKGDRELEDIVLKELDAGSSSLS
ncbi:hypothetical protein BGX27_003078 [Mortierella sp. AM989]|nr:hypothetical protein BGX27_003078 [Mortierella sp. AM989]